MLMMYWTPLCHQRSPEVLENALRWLERTEEPAIRHRVLDLGHAHTCFTALHLIFSECKTVHYCFIKSRQTFLVISVKGINTEACRSCMLMVNTHSPLFSR